MKEYLFYSTEGYTEGPNTDYNVNNCQVLGRAKGSNLPDAINNLLKENEWITKAGFSIESIAYVQVITNELKQDIKNVVNYLWKEEKTHFEECGKPKNHIFNTIKKLRWFSK